MKKIVYLILIGTLVLNAACQKKNREVPSPPPVKDHFGINVNDAHLDINGAGMPIVPTQADKIEIENLRWFELANNLFEAGSYQDKSTQVRMYQMADRIVRDYYSFQNGQIPMTALTPPNPGNPISEIMYSEVAPKLSSVFDQTVAESKLVVKTAANKLEIDPSKDLLEEILSGISEFVLDLEKGTKKYPNTKYVVTTIKVELENRILKGLKEIIREIKSFATKGSFEVLTAIKSTVSKFTYLDLKVRQAAIQKIDMALGVSKEIKDINDSTAAMVLVLDFWMNKWGRADVPMVAIVALRNFYHEELLAIAHNNQPGILSESEFKRLDKNYAAFNDVQLVAIATNNGYKRLKADYWASVKSRMENDLLPLLENETVKFYLKSVSTKEFDATKFPMYSLINGYLNLAARLSFPEKLVDAIGHLTENDIVKIQHTSTNDLILTGHPVLGLTRKGIIEAIETFEVKEGESQGQGLRNFKNMMDLQVKNAARDSFYEFLRPVGEKLGATLRDEILAGIDSEVAKKEKWMGIHLKKFIQLYLSKWIFNIKEMKDNIDDEVEDPTPDSIIAKYTVPLLEKRKMVMNKTSQGWEEGDSPFESSAEVFGEALKSLYYRMTLEDIPGFVDPSTLQGMAMNYQAINKMLLLIGYPKINNQPINSLYVSLDPNQQSAILDVANYKPNQLMFATPDYFRLNAPYYMDTTSQTGASFSVASQMSILNAALKFMKYFKPWKSSGFDKGLANVRIKEDETMVVFKKEQMFQIPLGVASVILRNAPLKMLTLLNESGKIFRGLPTDQLNKIGARAAMLSDFSMDGPSDKITAHNLATTVHTIMDLYEATSDLDQSKDPLVRGKDDSNIKDIEELRKLIREGLLEGMALFISSKMRNDDGGFYEYYDLKEQKPSSTPRRLRDQLELQAALLHLSNFKQADYLKKKAAENLFFLNSKFYKKDVGFYALIEDESVKTVRLADVAMALGNLSQIIVYLQATPTAGTEFKDSIEQAAKLRDSWLSRFFGSKFSEYETFQQVSDFGY